MRFIFLLITGIFLLGKFAAAQISQGGTPMQTALLKSAGIPVIEMMPVENRHLQIQAKKEQAAQLNLKPLRFAHPFQVHISPKENGVWLSAENSRQVWKVKIRSENAKSINLIFEEFQLPEKARLFIYSEKNNQTLGAFTSLNNKPGGKFAVSPVAGDEIIVQYEIPDEIKNRNNFVITQVNHDFEGVLKDERRPLNKLAGACNVDINCAAGNNWQDVKDAVCRIIVNGTEICSGTLVNNTKEDEKPYIISASHCYDKWEYAQTSVYTFNYESPYCAPLDGDPTHSVSGAVMKAQYDSLDFALTELSIAPPPEYHPYYAGWERRTILADSSVSIHHPQGDIKKIAVDNDAPEIDDFSKGYTKNGFLKVLRWEAGVTENGSSGGPLFNSAQKLIGTLTGGVATCANPVRDYFSRFGMAWDYKPDSTQQLKHWLDPANTGRTFLDGKRFFTDENLCSAFTNLDDSDIHKLIPLTNFGIFEGYWGGTNNVEITEITERFSISGYKRIAAVSMGIGKIDDAVDGKDSEITLKIYNGNDDFPVELIYSEVLKIKNLVENAMNRIELEEIVQPADTFFVGFELSNIMPGDSFVVFQSLREPEKENNFYFKQEGEWQNFKNSNIEGYALSSVFELLACGIHEAVTDSPLVKSTFEVLVFPNPTGSEVTIETGEEDLTIEDVKVFNLTGQLVDVNVNPLQENKTTVNFKGNAPGIYFVRIETAKGFVLKKISFVPW